MAQSVEISEYVIKLTADLEEMRTQFKQLTTELKTMGSESSKQFGAFKEESRKTGIETVAQLSSIQRAIGGISTGLALVAAKYAALYLVVSRVSRTLTSFIGEAAEAESVDRRLGFAVEALGYSYKKAKESLDDFADSIYKTTRFTDEDARRALTRMLMFTQDLDKAQRAVRIAFDMSAQSGMDYMSSIRMIGMALQGYGERLARFGVPEMRRMNQELGAGASLADKAEYAWRLLQKKFSGSAQAELQTYSGQVAQLDKAWREFKEVIGMEVLPWLTKLVKSLAETIEKVRELKAGIKDVLPEWMVGEKPGLSVGKQLAKDLKEAEGHIKTIEIALRKGLMPKEHGERELAATKKWADYLREQLADAKSDITSIPDDLRTAFEKVYGMTKKVFDFRISLEEAYSSTKTAVEKSRLETERAAAIAEAKRYSEDVFLVEEKYRKMAADQELKEKLNTLAIKEKAEVANAVETWGRVGEETKAIEGKYADERRKVAQEHSDKIKQIELDRIGIINEAYRKGIMSQYGFIPPGELPDFPTPQPTPRQRAEDEVRSRERDIERQRRIEDWRSQLAEVSHDYDLITESQVKSLEEQRRIHLLTEEGKSLWGEELEAYNKLTDAKIADLRVVREIQKEQNLIGLKVQLRELQGSWNLLKEAELAALDAQFKADILTKELTEDEKELTAQIYLRRKAELEAAADLNIIKLAEIGLKDFSIQANRDLAEAFKNIFPDSVRGAASTFKTLFVDAAKGELKSFKDYWIAFSNSIYEIWGNVIQKMAEKGLTDLLMEGIGGGNPLQRFFEMLGLAKKKEPVLSTAVFPVEEGMAELPGVKATQAVGALDVAVANVEVMNVGGGLADIGGVSEDVDMVKESFDGLESSVIDASDEIKEMTIDFPGMINTIDEGFGDMFNQIQEGLTEMVGSAGKGGGGLLGAIFGLFGGGGGAAAAEAGGIFDILNFQSGGRVPGVSGKTIRAELHAKEFVQPVPAVKYYGVGAMEAIRKMEVPREALRSYAAGGLVIVPANEASAPGSATNQREGREFNIFNVMDPSELDRYIASARGANALLNFMSSRAGTIKKFLR